MVFVMSYSSNFTHFKIFPAIFCLVITIISVIVLNNFLIFFLPRDPNLALFSRRIQFIFVFLFCYCLSAVKTMKCINYFSVLGSQEEQVSFIQTKLLVFCPRARGGESHQLVRLHGDYGLFSRASLTGILGTNDSTSDTGTTSVLFRFPLQSADQLPGIKKA